MKKLLSLTALLLMFTMSVSAQGKKSWLFYEGLSDETIANLNADTDNWASNGQEEDGTVYNWKNTKNPSKNSDVEWMANSQLIPELAGLKINIGSNGDNSIHLQTVRKGGDGKIRLTRKNTKITFPKLVNGQKITIQGRSANATATNRGIAPVQSYIKFQAEESSPQTGGACIFLGNQVEGSEGTYTFVWKIETEETDSVNVQFSLTPDAGIDFSYFMIDNGDAPDVEEAQSVAYVYDGNGDLDSDFAYIYLSGSSDRFALTEINTAETTADADSLRKFQAVVISPTIAADNAYLATLKQAVAYVPVLNFNPNLYEAFGYGKAVTSETNLLGVANADFAGFEGVVEDGVIPLLLDGNITAVELGDYFAADQVLAYAGEPVEGSPIAMHIHNAKRNAYVLLPLTLEDMVMANQDIIATLIPNTLSAIIETKKDIAAVGTPVISTNLQNGFTTVSITASNSNAIYYTLDGSDPTTESTLYTEPFNLTEATTVKAFATGDGYTDSKIAEKAIVIKVQASIPTIDVAAENGKSIITLSSQEGIDVFFNFNGAQTTALSQKYTEPIELDEPATIYVLAEGGDYLPSEIGQQEIAIEGYPEVIETLAHFDANQTDWFINDTEVLPDASGNASAYYFWGKNAWNYYSEEIDHEEILKDSEGNDSIVYYYKPNPDALRIITPLNDNGWVIKSRGQVLTGELQLAPGEGVGNGATGRFAEEAIDFLGGAPSKGAITFGGKTSGDPYTASIETSGKLPAPFNVIVYCGNGNNGSAATMEVQTSADGENWTAIGTLKMAETQRYIKRTRLGYEGQDEVYVRVAHVGGSTKAQVYDIYIITAAEHGPKILGDVNGDGAIDVADISAIISVMAGTATYPADVNGDGSVDVADISSVITKMAN